MLEQQLEEEEQAEANADGGPQAAEGRYRSAAWYIARKNQSIYEGMGLLDIWLVLMRPPRACTPCQS